MRQASYYIEQAPRTLAFKKSIDTLLAELAAAGIDDAVTREIVEDWAADMFRAVVDELRYA